MQKQTRGETREETSEGHERMVLYVLSYRKGIKDYSKQNTSFTDEELYVTMAYGGLSWTWNDGNYYLLKIYLKHLINYYVFWCYCNIGQ